MYLSFSLSSANCRKLKISLRSLGLSTSGSQWSAKGKETILRPVSQLRMRQKTIPFVKGNSGLQVV